MQKEHLEKAVSDAARIVADATRTVAEIETQANAANLALAMAKKARERHALKAAQNDAGALAAIKASRDNQRDAEAMLDDLRVALPEAQAQLAAAEKAASSARAELAKFQAAGLAPAHRCGRQA